MKDKKLLRFGLTGAAISALCCFTPILVLIVTSVGLSVIVAYLDFVLFPALFIFLGISVYAYFRLKNRQN